MNGTHTNIGMMRKIASPEEHNEAAGFVLDCILANGMIDDPLGDSAALRPTDVVRDMEGKLLFVLCAVRPCASGGMSAFFAPGEEEPRVLIGAT